MEVHEVHQRMDKADMDRSLVSTCIHRNLQPSLEHEEYKVSHFFFQIFAQRPLTRESGRYERYTNQGDCWTCN